MIDPVIVEIPVNMEYFDKDFAKTTGQITGVWFYDKNQKTHASELTPSYFLYFLYFKTENKLDDETDAILSDDGEDDTYRHCNYVEKCKTTKCRFSPDRTDSYKEQIDSIREYYRANHVV